MPEYHHSEVTMTPTWAEHSWHMWWPCATLDSSRWPASQVPHGDLGYLEHWINTCSVFRVSPPHLTFSSSESLLWSSRTCPVQKERGYGQAALVFQVDTDEHPCGAMSLLPSPCLILSSPVQQVLLLLLSFHLESVRMSQLQANMLPTDTLLISQSFSAIILLLPGDLKELDHIG